MLHRRGAWTSDWPTSGSTGWGTTASRPRTARPAWTSRAACGAPAGTCAGPTRVAPLATRSARPASCADGSVGASRSRPTARRWAASTTEFFLQAQQGCVVRCQTEAVLRSPQCLLLPAEGAEAARTICLHQCVVVLLTRVLRPGPEGVVECGERRLPARVVRLVAAAVEPEVAVVPGQPLGGFEKAPQHQGWQGALAAGPDEFGRQVKLVRDRASAGRKSRQQLDDRLVLLRLVWCEDSYSGSCHERMGRTD